MLGGANNVQYSLSILSCDSEAFGGKGQLSVLNMLCEKLQQDELVNGRSPLHLQF